MPPRRFQLLRTAFRYAFHVAAGFSLLLLVACLILWPRSYHRVDVALFSTGTGAWQVASAGGRLCLLWWHRRGDSHFSWASLDRRPEDERFETPWSYASWRSKRPVAQPWVIYPPEGSWDVWKDPVEEYCYLGWQLRRHHGIDSVTLTCAYVPYSYLSVLAALLPTLELRRFLRRRRAARLARPGFPIEPPLPPTAAAR